MGSQVLTNQCQYMSTNGLLTSNTTCKVLHCQSVGEDAVKLEHLDPLLEVKLSLRGATLTNQYPDYLTTWSFHDQKMAHWAPFLLTTLSTSSDIHPLFKIIISFTVLRLSHPEEMDQSFHLSSQTHAS